ncbi:hypothetical protein HJC23_004107 [Cyclotella cryptica]|uniref:Uncharacterized protein n=1 Tax=Cyclotella cryptica TaxID=29204 RepID=A0ABD3NIM8_9STRA
MMRIPLHLLVIGAVCNQVSAFISLVDVGVASYSYCFRQYYRTPETLRSPTVTTRKFFVGEAVRVSFGISIATSATTTPTPAFASGGATAGGAYLLSAKQRYNKRVLSGVNSFLGLDARDVNQVAAFFASPDEGAWEDLSAAGYLLANAFRTSSTKAPDNLPSVKSLAKRWGEDFAAYKSAKEKLYAYLVEVELTSLAPRVQLEIA